VGLGERQIGLGQHADVIEGGGFVDSVFFVELDISEADVVLREVNLNRLAARGVFFRVIVTIRTPVGPDESAIQSYQERDAKDFPKSVLFHAHGVIRRDISDKNKVQEAVTILGYKLAAILFPHARASDISAASSRARME